MAARGETDGGIANIREALAAWRATGAEFARPYWLVPAGQFGEGLALLPEAWAVVDKNLECWWEASWLATS